MLIALVKIFLGILVLSWSADKLVSGSCTLAKILGVAPLLIGLTIVAIGTSLPEVVISILASLKDNSDIALGNAIGSNITNLGLVIGICALTHSLTIERSTVLQEIPLLMAYTLIVCAIVTWFGLNFITSTLLFIGALGFIYWLIKQGLEQRTNFFIQEETIAKEVVHELPPAMPLPLALFYIAVGIMLLPVSANILISGATELARLLEISETVIGLTMVALGTSLPELAASIVATLKREYGIAIGNIVGSNIFNLTAVLCPIGFINPNFELDRMIFLRDIPVMILMTLIFTLFARQNKTKPSITRLNGGIFLFIYTAYIFGFIAESLFLS